MSGKAALRTVATVLVLGAGGVGFLPIALADSQTVFSPTVEAWYQPNPTCASPAGCQSTSALPAPPPANSPFPAGTLHVGLSAGQETARSYLAFPLNVGLGTVTGGTLTVPLDTAAADGSSSPETAVLQVCVVSAPITAVQGSFELPPRPDCGTAVGAKYTPLPQPHLVADLTPIAAQLSSATGLALLPDATKAAPTAAWRVVFSAHDRTDAAKTPPASLQLSLADPVQQPTQDPFVSFPGSNPLPPAEVAPPNLPGFVPPPTVGGPMPTQAPPVVATLPSTQVGAGRTITVGYAYPAVWLLPLALLLLVPLAARALTRDLTPL